MDNKKYIIFGNDGKPMEPDKEIIKEYEKASEIFNELTKHNIKKEKEEKNNI